MFRWAKALPYWERIGSVFWLALFVAAVGALSIAIGLLMGNVEAIIAGVISVIPAVFAWFLLWRSYVDDGYRMRRATYGHRHQKDN